MHIKDDITCNSHVLSGCNLTYDRRNSHVRFMTKQYNYCLRTTIIVASCFTHLPAKMTIYPRNTSIDVLTLQIPLSNKRFKFSVSKDIHESIENNQMRTKIDSLISPSLSLYSSGITSSESFLYLFVILRVAYKHKQSLPSL